MHDWIATLHRDHAGKYVVAEDYYVEQVLDEDRLGEMRFDEEGVRIADGEPAVRATLDRPLRGRPLVFVGTEMAADEAWAETGVCVAHQFWKLATRDGRPVFDSLEATLAAFEQAHAACEETPDDWRAEGITSRMVEWVCREQGVPLMVLWRGAPILTVSEPPGKPFVYAIMADHCYALINRIALKSARVPPSIPESVLAKDIHREPVLPKEPRLLAPGDELEAGELYLCR